MSGIKKRIAVFTRWKGGVQDTLWRKVTTEIGAMLEVAPYSLIRTGTQAYDSEYNDQMAHINDITFLPFKDWNRLSGTEGGVHGSKDGHTHAGQFIYYDQP